MGIDDYRVSRDKFELEDAQGMMQFAFPCSSCKHKHGSHSDEPCRTCDHNGAAVPDKTSECFDGEISF